jgi:hypothetical protein
MALRKTVDDINAVPEALRSLYVQDGAKWKLDVDEGGGNGEDVAGLKSALGKERQAREQMEKALNDLRKALGNEDPQKLMEARKKLQELEDKQLIDAGKLDEVLAQRTQRMQEDHAAQIAKFNEKLKEREKEVGTLSEQLSTVLIDGAVTAAAHKAGVKKSALDDVVLRARQVFRFENGKVVAKKDGTIQYGKDPNTPLAPEEWVGGLVKDAGHLFEPSNGGGSSGSVQRGQATGQIAVSKSAARANPKLYQEASAEAQKKGLELVFTE